MALADSSTISILRVEPRLLSPGEAKNPGPVSSLIAQTQQTILDAFSRLPPREITPQTLT
eukprot:5734909-Amphidinium_carterae.4